jgi:uncharacterized membrane-anchored protein YhcB (DUF1043 family)
MIQQINLYQETEASHSHLILNPYLLAGGAIFAGLLVTAFLTRQSLGELQAQRQQLQQQLQTATAEVLMLQAQLPNQQSNSLLEQQLQQSQSVFQSLSNVVEMLADDQSDQTQGFSRYFMALANQSDSKVWLSKIEINAINDSLSLQGSTFQAELIPVLLQRLQQTEAFKGRHFSQMQIRQAKDSAEQVDFSVSSGQPAKDENASRP